MSLLSRISYLFLRTKKTQRTFYIKFPPRSNNSSEAKSRAKIISQNFSLKKKKKKLYSMSKAKERTICQIYQVKKKRDGFYPEAVLVQGTVRTNANHFKFLKFPVT